MTLTKLKAGKSAKPYTEPVKVNVCGVGSASNYTTDKGEDKQTVVVGVADKDTVMKVVVYDDNKLVSMTVGNAVMLTNYIFKTTPEPQIIITAKSKVMRTASIAVKDELREEAARIANPPPAATVPLGQVKLSPVKSLVSVKGKIVSEEIAKTVQVRGTDITVKTVTVKSGEEQINLTLWRDLAARSLMGQFLQIDNVVVNSYRNEVSLNTTARTKIETCDEPTTSVTGTLIGFECQELTVSLMVEVSETFPSFDISKATVLQALDVTDADIEDELMNRIPTAITLAVRDGNAETITFEADGVLYVSKGKTAVDQAASLCNLATPDIHFGTTFNTVSLDGADLNKADGKSVLSGYVQTYAAFLYEGCFEQNPLHSPAIHTNMSRDTGQCFSKCNTNYIGMQNTSCHCNPRLEEARKYATGCTIECSNPTGTVCGGSGAVSIYRKVKYPEPRDDERNVAENQNCRALLWRSDGERRYSWRECRSNYHGMCGNGAASSLLEFYRGATNWSQSAFRCLNDAKQPALEFKSGFPDLNVSSDFDNYIWTGQIRSRVIGKHMDSNGSEPGWRRGFITKWGGNFVLRFSSNNTTMKSLCENVSTSTPGDLRNSSEQNTTPDDDSQSTMISTSTPGDYRTSTEQNATPDDDPQSTMKLTSAHEEYRNSSEQNARLDDDQQFPMIAVYTAVPVVLVLVAVVVILILCTLRKRTVRKQDDQSIRQDSDHSGLGTRHAVSNESYEDCDVRHDNIILEPVNEYAVVNDADINVAIDTEYDTTTNLNKSSNDTDNVYNKRESLSDDTYNHTNTAAASVDDTYDKATFDEHDSTYNTTNTLPGSSIGHVIDTDGVYSKVNI